MPDIGPPPPIIMREKKDMIMTSPKQGTINPKGPIPHVPGHQPSCDLPGPASPPRKNSIPKTQAMRNTTVIIRPNMINGLQLLCFMNLSHPPGSFQIL
jgi:hypothetical protein